MALGLSHNVSHSRTYPSSSDLPEGLDSSGLWVSLLRAVALLHSGIQDTGPRLIRGERAALVGGNPGKPPLLHIFFKPTRTSEVG